MIKRDQRSFSEFWLQIHRLYLISCAKFALLWPLTTLVVGYLIFLLQCYGWIGGLQENACFYVATPFAYLHRWGSLWHLSALTLVIVFAAMLFFEWINYRKNNPSYLTHGAWSIEGPPGYKRRLKEVSSDKFMLGTQELQAQVVNEHHRRYAGNFSEEELLKHIRRKFARRDNKPVLDASDKMVWKIKQSSGTEVHIDLSRNAGRDGIWTMRTEFYEWAGRKNPPRFVQTHVTEFEPNG